MRGRTFLGGVTAVADQNVLRLIKMDFHCCVVQPVQDACFSFDK